MMVFLKKKMFIKGINEGDGIAEYDFINNINYQIWKYMHFTNFCFKIFIYQSDWT